MGWLMKASSAPIAARMSPIGPPGGRALLAGSLHSVAAPSHEFQQVTPATGWQTVG
jgi:hypothetical protein